MLPLIGGHPTSFLPFLNHFFSLFSGLFYEKHLKYIKLNDMPIRFTSMDLGYLHKVKLNQISFSKCLDFFVDFKKINLALTFTQDVYDVQFVKKVYASPIVSYEELKTGKMHFDGDVRIQYHTKDMYKRTAKMLGLMDDFRVNIL